MTPYERVQQSRQRTAATFPLPSPVDCIRYAITELAEYDDALLRQERAGDKRNNDRQHDPAAELGQALYMLLSAAVQLEHNPIFFPLRLSHASDCYFKTVEWLGQMGNYGTYSDGMFLRCNDVYSAMCRLCDLHGWDVDALIDDTCAAFEAKHAAVSA